MNVNLFKEYRFEAAHQLPHVAPGHKCANLHGHSYRFEIEVAGPVDAHSGWLIDFGVLDDLVMPLVLRLDHRYLNDIEGLANPTSEVLAGWLWEHIKSGLPQLVSVIVWETHDARCVYRGA